MLDRIYVNELLWEWHRNELKERDRMRRGGPERPSTPRRLAALIGRGLVRLGASLYGWGERNREEQVVVLLVPREP